ncbi:hypothetical protein EGW08_009044 [Elysia chlorotica]|uniref:N-acetyltransferase domain-containing protein n=1 Tax=Elysia chlorotica TaxID=188477 RepID=A0A433TNM9_ELYCH|nr:hypothetical protein EGW08_009044 [Elysia chlorotica]
MDSSMLSSCAYCGKNEPSWDELLHFKCDACEKKVHLGCIKSSPPSPLLDDTFFQFKCNACSDDRTEDFTRMKMSWQDTVALCLYHLQKTNQGRCGFFHWRLQICAFIDQHWRCLFGQHRKKTTLWLGTVGGTLSSGCPEMFTSGANVVEMGYWRLTHLKPPLPQTEKKRSGPKKRVVSDPPVYLPPEARRCRKKKDSVLTAAMELKEKRAVTVTKAKRHTEKKKNKGKAETEPATVPETEVGMSQSGTIYFSDAEDNTSMSSSSVTVESFVISHSQEEVPFSVSDTRLDFLNTIKLEAEDGDDDFDIDIGTITTMPDFRPESPDLSSVLGCVSESTKSDVIPGKSPVKNPPGAERINSEVQEQDEASLGTGEEIGSERGGGEYDGSGLEDESEDDSSDDAGSDKSEGDEGSETSVRTPLLKAPKRKKGRPKKRGLTDEPPPSSPPRLKRISVFEERELLQKLNVTAEYQTLRPDLAQLRRKLICNQTNREFGFPVFDLDSQLQKMSRPLNSGNLPPSQDSSFLSKLSMKTTNVKETRDLDRFMMHERETKSKTRTYTTFHQRLVGFEDHELKPTVSPYTTRLLLPFIWRNYNPIKKPLKLRLLREIQDYPHRNDPSWEPPPTPPIDFCYVRPEHIPSVNALCREFFWPGIDMSECLQYPDFSCVVLYRKIVIAFAFMVPDRGYNEAYISFIFTHPEWRGAGIAKFMLYHLIQTCMGKDVLLHVSATNTAMLLYQKFGFKAQELILNFYYKYFPFDCKDSTHAFLMRLTR